MRHSDDTLGSCLCTSSHRHPGLSEGSYGSVDEVPRQFARKPIVQGRLANKLSPLLAKDLVVLTGGEQREKTLLCDVRPVRTISRPLGLAGQNVPLAF